MRRSKKDAKRGLRIGWLALTAVLVTGIGLSGSGTAAPPVRSFEVALAPTSMLGGKSAAHTLSLTNKTTSNLGSASVAVPTGFDVDPNSLSASGPRPSWTPSYDAATRTIRVRASSGAAALVLNEVLQVTFTATAPCVLGASGPWTSAAWQSTNFSGTQFPNPPTQPVTTVGAGRLSVSAPAGPVLVGAPFAAQVSTTDGCMGEEDFGSLRLSGLSSFVADDGTVTPPSYDVTWTGPGVATVTVTPVKSQFRAVLTAADDVRTAGVSAPFDVVDAICTNACEAKNNHGNTKVTASQAPGLAIGFDDGGDAPVSCSARALGSVITLIPPTGWQPTQVTFTWSKETAPGTGVSNFVLCWNKPGASRAVELPACGKKGPRDQTCELSRSRTGVGELVISIWLTEDPSFELG